MPTKRRRKVTVLLDKEAFESLDAFCQERGFKKSTLIARLIRDHLAAEGFHIQRKLPLPPRTNEGSR